MWKLPNTLPSGCWANATTGMLRIVSLLARFYVGNKACSLKSRYQLIRKILSASVVNNYNSFPSSFSCTADSTYTTVEGAPPHILAFMEHYHSIPWMTYRANFSQIRGTTLSTDCGWGCMVRSGQMILATALHRHLLNQEWRFTTSNVKDLAMHKQVSK